MSRRVLPVALGIVVLSLGCARQPVAVRPKAAWRVVPVAGVSATLDVLDAGQGSGQALRLRFAKAGAERRLVVIEGKPQGDPAAAKALSIMYCLTLAHGECPKLALLLLEKDGGAWFKVGAAPLATEAATEARLPLDGFRRAEFAQDADSEPRRDQLDRVWLGLVLDGPAEGTLELGRVAFIGEAYRPTAPLPLPCGDPAAWTIGKDAAAECRLAPAKDGPAGQPSMRIEFAFPGGRHMFVLPTLRLQDVELEGYRGIRFVYKARLPEGIAGLLVSVTERGDHSQYYAEQAPEASAEWAIADIAFGRLKLGPWSKDDNGRLDLNEIAGLTIGVHGAASEPKASGWIVVSEIELVP
ncbi:MAG: hypothetical protein FJ290_26675 [Planctomycetes bacterium]|nr:hypothetical protein [Planctomycetota bacterium]